MEGCWPVALISVGLPSIGAGFLLRTYPDYWQYILPGWGAACLVLLSWLAGTDLLIPATQELELFTRIRDAFTEICGPLPFAFSVVAGGILGFGAGQALQSRDD